MKKISNRRMITLGAYALIIGGSLLLFTYRQTHLSTDQPSANDALSQQAAQPTSPDPTAQATQPQATGTPVRIQILEADINVAVAPGVYNPKSKTWTLSSDKAQFALMTTKPNTQGGNTFIYGHNRKSVFSRLTGVKPGSTAVVTTDSNQRFVYRMRASNTTKPEDSSTLYYTGPPILTLQTCTGSMFQNRTLYVFDLVGVTNA